MKIIVITSDHLRHKYVANRLIEIFEVAAVFAEQKNFEPTKGAGVGADLSLINEHFQARGEAEKKYFGNNREFRLPPERIHYLSMNSINNSEVVAKMKQYEPDAVAVFGSSILKKPVIDVCPGKIINIHLGLSPYYRGAGTNFWPFVNDEPEFAGVTVHYLDEGIDTGRILHQGYAVVERGDRFHDSGCKTIILAADLLVRTLKELENGTLGQGVPQQSKGKLYLMKDFNAQAVRKLYHLFDEGLVDKYLDELASGRRRKPAIIE